MLKLAKLVVNCKKRYILTRNVTSTSCLSCSINSEQMDKSKKFTPIYHFPYIRILATINRLKLYQTGFTVLAIPASILCRFLNVISTDTVVAISVLGFCGCIPLYSLGYMFGKFIGFIYYNPEEDIVKVSYVDSWGRRKDVEVLRKDIMPISDLPSTFIDLFYLPFTRFSSNQKLKLNLKFGNVLNEEFFKKVLT